MKSAYYCTQPWRNCSTASITSNYILSCTDITTKIQHNHATARSQCAETHYISLQRRSTKDYRVVFFFFSLWITDSWILKTNGDQLCWQSNKQTSVLTFSEQMGIDEPKEQQAAEWRTSTCRERLHSRLHLAPFEPLWMIQTLNGGAAQMSRRWAQVSLIHWCLHSLSSASILRLEQ